jgi:hypothetical protein
VSEYQYYEFLAIDRPLSDADMRWLRSLSTRARITSTSFTNEYHWGNFKGDPGKLMERCFDAHVYTSNFGSRRLMLKLPEGELDLRALRAYGVGGRPEIKAVSTGIVLDFIVDDEPSEWEDEGGTAWMASLAPLRGELLEGDLRSLYLGWLLNLPFGELEPDRAEPAVPAGLGALSAPCEALVDFLGLDRTLLTLAAERSGPRAFSEFAEDDWRTALARLSEAERDDLLVKLLTDDGATTRRNLRARLRAERSRAAARSRAGERPGTTPRRTVGEIQAEWERRMVIAEREAAEEAERERRRLAEALAKARHEHLTRIAARGAAVWKEVESLIQTSNPTTYDRAVELLIDLRDAAALLKKSRDFAARLSRLRTAHGAKPSLMRRLNTANLV